MNVKKLFLCQNFEMMEWKTALTVWTVACRQMTEGALQEHVVVAEDIQASLLDGWLYMS